jgi:hypothetical protein
VPLHVRNGVAFAGEASGRVHVGTDAAARADAIRRVRDWLSR